MKIRDLVESIEENITVKIDGKNLSEEIMDLKIKEINIKTGRWNEKWNKYRTVNRSC